MGATIIGLSKKIYPQAFETRVDINHINLTLPNLAPEFNDYRLVQISDIHIGTWMNRPRLCEAIDLVNRQHPDLVAITGDFVTYDPERFADDLTTTLRRLKSRDGVVAVLGNHDHWSGATAVRKILRASNVTELRNAVYTIHRGKANLNIAGIDDHMTEFDHLDSVMAKLSPDGAAILLAHVPDFADISMATGRFDLQISGHTHGGQVRLPRVGPPFLPRFGRKYPMGYYRIGEMHLYTNRGLGTGEIQVRLNCRPEITVFTLQSVAAGESKPV
jgi:predicted MPP superfamily phosphohydrolase